MFKEKQTVKSRKVLLCPLTVLPSHVGSWGSMKESIPIPNKRTYFPFIRNPISPSALQTSPQQGCLADTEMHNRGPLSRVSPHTRLLSTSDTQDYLLAAVPRRKTKDDYFFLVGITESRGRELGRRRGAEGWETHTVRFVFRKQPGWICKSSSCFLKMRFL